MFHNEQVQLSYTEQHTVPHNLANCYQLLPTTHTLGEELTCSSKTHHSSLYFLGGWPSTLQYHLVPTTNCLQFLHCLNVKPVFHNALVKKCTWPGKLISCFKDTNIFLMLLQHLSLIAEELKFLKSVTSWVSINECVWYLNVSTAVYLMTHVF